jgi:hypothetical protein
VAQTPDGTRVATPNPMRDGPAADSMPSAKASYASAAKTKPNDWHLEFSIEGHTLPLETTVYGAIHQHEARRSAKPSFYLSTIWSGVYTIKFKKASGPARLPDSMYPFPVLSNFLDSCWLQILQILSIVPAVLQHLLCQTTHRIRRSCVFSECYTRFMLTLMNELRWGLHKQKSSPNRLL